MVAKSEEDRLGTNGFDDYVSRKKPGGTEPNAVQSETSASQEVNKWESSAPKPGDRKGGFSKENSWSKE